MTDATYNVMKQDNGVPIKPGPRASRWRTLHASSF